MIKEDLILTLTQNSDLNRNDAKILLNSMLMCMENVLISKKKLLITGFGRFEVKKKQKRIGRNPKSGKEYEISERYVLVFYPSKQTINKINQEII